MILASADIFSADYHNLTTVHPLGLAVLLACGVCLLYLPHRHAMLAFLTLACFVSQAQRLALLGLDFNFLRIMVLFGWVRVMMRQEGKGFQWHALDWAMLAYAVVNSTVYSLHYATPSAVINRLGTSFDTVGMYFLFRVLVRSLDDVRQAIRWAMVLAIPVAVGFFLEKSTGRNLFAFLGGVPEFTRVREGRLRVQGAFAHPIVAGCFWASLLPLMGAMWFRGGRDRLWAYAGVPLACLLVMLTSSATPLLAVIAGAFGMVMYGVKPYMRWIRWGALLIVVGLHIVMLAPVWHLIARVSAVGGNSGWHRFVLIDGAINHIDEWWLMGTSSTAHWGHYTHDVANEYVLEAVRGGIWGLVAFIVVIAIAFGRIGRAWRAVPAGPDRIMIWAIGVSLFVHCVNFIGLSYFGQVTMLWYLTLAVIGSLAVTTQQTTSTEPGKPSARFAHPPQTLMIGGQ